MKVSDRGIAFLVAHEGIVPAPYFDSVGVLTYGIGHTRAAGDPDPAKMKRGMPTDLDHALRNVFGVFRRDLAKYEAEVNKALGGMKVAQHEFDAAVSFHFNTGAIATAAWVKTWRAGNKKQAAAEILNWRKPPEIIPRRTAEQALFRDGTYGANRATVWQVNTDAKVIWKVAKTLSQAQIIDLLRPGSAVRPAAKPVGGKGTIIPILIAAAIAVAYLVFGG